MRLSATSIDAYQTCPKRFYYTYVLGLLQRDSTPLKLGKSYHSSLEKLEEYGLEESTKRACEDGVDLELLRKMVETYLKNPVAGNIVEREKYFKLTAGDVEVSGKIDRIDEDKIVDYKTTSTDYKYEDCLGIQTDIYIWAMEELTGVRYPFVYSIVNKKKLDSKKYQAQIIKVDVADYNKENLLKTIKEVDTKIKNKEFEPTPGKHCFFCPFGRMYGTNNCKASL
jgi:CRISPR/Cas system-associated exonuclease Cas4 (RecB family)